MVATRWTETSGAAPRSIRPYCGREIPAADAITRCESPLAVRARLNS